MFEMEVCRPEALGSSLEPSLQPAHHPPTAAIARHESCIRVAAHCRRCPEPMGVTAGYSLATGSCPFRKWRVEWGSNVGCCCAAPVKGHIPSSRQAPREAGGRLLLNDERGSSWQAQWCRHPLVLRSKVGTPYDTSTATSGPVEPERWGGNWGMT